MQRLKLYQANFVKKLFLMIIFITWLSHGINVFTPEVGFDAVWYHLPIIKQITKFKHLVYLPDLYQSVNPQLADLFFLSGYFYWQEAGAKIVAYFFGLGLVLVVYYLTRLVLDKNWSLVVVAIISGFQVVAWQSSSFYVDVAKAFFEILSLLALFKWRDSLQHYSKWLILSALFFGFSLASKLFSLFLVPVFLVLVWYLDVKKKTIEKLKSVLLFAFISFLPAMPFYLFAYYHTGSFFYSFTAHLQKFSEITAGLSLSSYFFKQTLNLPILPIRLLFAQDYTSIILIIFLPLLLVFWQEIIKQKKLVGLLLFSFYQVLVWWYLPPLSTRYALSGFIALTVVLVWSAAYLAKQNRKYFLPIIFTILISLAMNFVPRLIVNIRSWRYIIGQVSKEKYLEQFMDGNIDEHLKNWYYLDKLH